jgi:signal transduction histidine kinase
VVAEAEFLEATLVIIDAENIMLAIDQPKVERIVENLLANTVRHTPPGTNVWVRLLRETGGVILAVEDDGPGIPPDMREAVFEAFRQGESPSRHSPGAGVGLSLVSAFAELHGGRAWVEDRSGGGASFRVFLPFPPR